MRIGRLQIRVTNNPEYGFTFFIRWLSKTAMIAVLNFENAEKQLEDIRDIRTGAGVPAKPKPRSIAP